jgi:hypothetical protein
MDQLDDRDERFIAWFAKLNATFGQSILNVAWRVLPRRAALKLAIFLCDPAEPVGKLAGSIYNVVRDTGDFIRWLVYGSR